MEIRKEIIIAFIIVGISIQLGYSQEKIKLHIIVTGIKDSGGKLEVGLYNNAKNFPKDDREYLSEIIPVAKDEVEVSFYVQQGEYAIALYHDKNDNQVCDNNFFGIPKEGFGFSNNVKPFLSAPSFRKAKINLVEDTTIFIQLIYM